MYFLFAASGICYLSNQIVSFFKKANKRINMKAFKIKKIHGMLREVKKIRPKIDIIISNIKWFTDVLQE